MKLELEIGKHYTLKTGANETVIPLQFTDTPGRAIFYVKDFVHQFVSWGYRVISEDTIECWSGEYYKTLKEAINDYDE